jgi:hypothetical protein
MGVVSGHIHIRDIQGIQSHEIPDDGVRGGSQNVSVFTFDMTDVPRRIYKKRISTK